MNYIYHPTTGLWYPIIAQTVEGEITSGIDQSGGVLTPPAYVADVGDPLINTDYYLCFTQSVTLPVSELVWNVFACTVSDLVESYCKKSWRVLVEEVPLPVQMVTAFTTRDLIVNKAGNTGLYKSYSGGDYSWTLQDGITPGDILAPYKSLLNPYRELSIYA